MSKHQPIAAMLLVLTAALATACDPSAAVLDSVGRPTSLCSDIGDGHCPRPSNPGDIKPN